MTTPKTTPAKRAPRKAAAKPAADVTGPGVTAAGAQAAREQLEATTGTQVTSTVVAKLRGGVRYFTVVRPDGTEAPAGDDGTPPDPAQAELEAPDDAELAAVRAYDPPPADDDWKPARDDDYTPEAIARDEAAALVEDVAPQAGVDVLAAVTLEAPDGQRGTLIGPADRLAEVVRPEAVVDELKAAIAEAYAEADADTRPGLGAEDVEEAFDPRALVAPAPADVEDELDVRQLVAGTVTTAPDGTRVTVFAWPGVDDAPAPPGQPVAAGAPASPAATLADGVQLPGEDPRPHPGVDPRVVKLSPELAAAIEEARALEARAAELTEAAKAIRSQVQEALGGDTGLGEIAAAPDGTELARWTRVTSTRLDQKALKLERPDVHAAFTKTTSTRRFVWAD